LDDCGFVGFSVCCREDCLGESARNIFVEFNGLVICRYSNNGTEVHGMMFLVIVVVNTCNSHAD
jgi:hypothetical protein